MKDNIQQLFYMMRYSPFVHLLGKRECKKGASCQVFGVGINALNTLSHSWTLVHKHNSDINETDHGFSFCPI